jgi:hypothetical protein
MGKGKLSALAGAVLSVALMIFSLSAQARPPVAIRAEVGVRYPYHYPVHVWGGGYWHHGWYGPRFGWWWVVGPSWYYYPAPVYPYPNPYVPPVVIQTTPAQPGPAPAQYWYYCAASKAYYPYVAECPGGWQQVPATPPPSTTPPGH